ncbi:MAG: hypothetical protein EOO65_03265 [Methanosarcinales archaeon]|nr:MAG: hypothetical protein EOO65_03265 [Methanosarcinales archaeon]
MADWSAGAVHRCALRLRLQEMEEKGVGNVTSRAHALHCTALHFTALEHMCALHVCTACVCVVEEQGKGVRQAGRQGDSPPALLHETELSWQHVRCVTAANCVRVGGLLHHHDAAADSALCVCACMQWYQRGQGARNATGEARQHGGAGADTWACACSALVHAWVVRNECVVGRGVRRGCD